MELTLLLADNSHPHIIQKVPVFGFRTDQRCCVVGAGAWGQKAQLGCFQHPRGEAVA